MLWRRAGRTDNNAHKLTRAGGGWGSVKEVVIGAATPPPPCNRLLRFHPGLYNEGDLPLGRRTRPCLRAPLRGSRRGKTDPPERPFRGSMSTPAQMWGGGRLFVEGRVAFLHLGAASPPSRPSPGHELQGRPPP